VLQPRQRVEIAELLQGDVNHDEPPAVLSSVTPARIGSRTP